MAVSFRVKFKWYRTEVKNEKFFARSGTFGFAFQTDMIFTLFCAICTTQ